MALHGTIIRHGATLAIECHSAFYNEPKSCRHVWPMSRYVVRGMCSRDPETAIGKAATIQDGRISCYLGDGAYLHGEMEQGGQTPAVIVETVDVPCPKVRSDTETRWHNGAWQKYTKRQGWIAI